MRNIAMKGKALSFMLFSVVLFTFSAGVSASGGVINFKGQVVNTGCEVRLRSDDQSLEDMQQVQVSSQITLVVNTYRNACSDDVIPFNTTFTALPSSETTAVTGFSTGQKSNVGIVTLTYE